MINLHIFIFISYNLCKTVVRVYSVPYELYIFVFLFCIFPIIYWNNSSVSLQKTSAPHYSVAVNPKTNSLCDGAL